MLNDILTNENTSHHMVEALDAVVKYTGQCQTNYGRRNQRHIF